MKLLLLSNGSRVFYFHTFIRDVKTLRSHDEKTLRSHDEKTLRSHDEKTLRSHDLKTLRSYDVKTLRSHDVKTLRSHEVKTLRSYDEKTLWSYDEKEKLVISSVEDTFRVQSINISSFCVFLCNNVLFLTNLSDSKEFYSTEFPLNVILINIFFIKLLHHLCVLLK